MEERLKQSLVKVQYNSNTLLLAYFVFPNLDKVVAVGMCPPLFTNVLYVYKGFGEGLQDK